MSAFDKLARSNPDVATIVSTAVQRGVAADAIAHAVRSLWPNERPAFYRRVKQAAEALHAPCFDTRIIGHAEEINLSGQGTATLTLVVRDPAGGRHEVVATDEGVLKDLRMRLQRSMQAAFIGSERQTPGGWFEFVLTGFVLPGDNEPHAVLIINDDEIRHGWIAPTRQDAVITARRWYAARRAMNRADDVSGECDDLYDDDPDPATATIWDIAAWYAAGDTGWDVQIAPITLTEVVSDCLSELDAIADPTVRDTYRRAVLDAVADVHRPDNA